MITTESITIFSAFVFHFLPTRRCFRAFFDGSGAGGGDVASLTSRFRLLLRLMAGFDFIRQFAGGTLSTSIGGFPRNPSASANPSHWPIFFSSAINFVCFVASAAA